MTHSHRDYEPFEMAENMEEDLGLFEAAVRSTHVDLDFSPCGKVVWIVDDSPIQSTVQIFATSMAKRLSVQGIHRAAADSIVGSTTELQNAGLIVSPIPLGRDAQNAASTSLGAGADELLRSSPAPVLFVRQPMNSDAVEASVDTLLAVVWRHDPEAEQEIAWAFRLARSQIVLLELVDSVALQEATKLLQGRQEDPEVERAVVARAVDSQLGSIVAAAQKHSRDRGVSLHVEFRLGPPVQEILDVIRAFSCGMVILSRPKDHTLASFHLSGDLLLATDLPVLVI